MRLVYFCVHGKLPTVISICLFLHLLRARSSNRPRVPPAKVAKVEHNTCTSANGLLPRSMIDFDDQCGQTESVGNQGHLKRQQRRDRLIVASGPTFSTPSHVWNFVPSAT